MRHSIGNVFPTLAMKIYVTLRWNLKLSAYLRRLPIIVRNYMRPTLPFMTLVPHHQTWAECIPFDGNENLFDFSV